MPFPYIYCIRRDIRLYDKYRILVAPGIETFPLPYRVELCPVVLPDYLAERIVLVPCLLDMVFAGAVCLSLEAYPSVCYRLRKPFRCSRPHAEDCLSQSFRTLHQSSHQIYSLSQAGHLHHNCPF